MKLNGGVAGAILKSDEIAGEVPGAGASGSAVCSLGMSTEDGQARGVTPYLRSGQVFGSPADF